MHRYCHGSRRRLQQSDFFRVSVHCSSKNAIFDPLLTTLTRSLTPLLGLETQQLAHLLQRRAKTRRFRSRTRIRRPRQSNDMSSGDEMVSTSRAALWITVVFVGDRYLVDGNDLCRAGAKEAVLARGNRHGSTQEDHRSNGYTDRGRLARSYVTARLYFLAGNSRAAMDTLDFVGG